MVSTHVWLGMRWACSLTWSRSRMRTSVGSSCATASMAAEKKTHPRRRISLQAVDQLPDCDFIIGRRLVFQGKFQFRHGCVLIAFRRERHPVMVMENRIGRRFAGELMKNFNG